MKKVIAVALSASVLAILAAPAQANWSSSTSGLTTTYTENFEGSTSFSGGVRVEAGSDDYMSLESGGGGNGATSYSFTFLTDIASVSLSFWYTGSTNSDPVGSVTLVRTNPTPITPVFPTIDFNAVAGLNPGPGVGLQYNSPLYTNLSAGTYLLRFARGGGQDVFRVDDVVVAVTAVPEPATIAMMLAGLGIVGVATRRRNRDLRV